MSLSTGDSSLGSSGSISLSVGDSVAGSGSSINLNAGSNTGAPGGNINLKAGTGSSSGSVHFVNPSTSVNYGVISDSTFDFSGLSTISLASTGTVQLTSSTTLTFSALSGISLGDSNVSGFETDSGTVGSVVPGEVTINAMAGKITSEDTSLASNSKDTFTLYNSRVTASSLVMVTPSNDAGCEPIVYKAVPYLGYVDIGVKNIDSSECSAAYTLSFLVVN